MKLIKSPNLLSSLLSSDLIFFSTNKIKIRNINLILDRYKVTKTNYYTLLNIIPLLCSIKQLIRLVQFQIKHLTSNMQLISSNTCYTSIIEYLSTKFSESKSIIRSHNRLNTKINSKILVSFCNDNNNKKLIDIAFKHNINVVFLINNIINKMQLGNYSMFNNLTTYKRVVFLIVILLLAQKL